MPSDLLHEYELESYTAYTFVKTEEKRKLFYPLCGINVYITPVPKWNLGCLYLFGNLCFGILYGIGVNI